MCFFLKCADVENGGDLEEFVINYKGVVMPNSFGTKCKRQKQLLATLERANIASPKPPIPRTPTPTLPVVAPTMHIIEVAPFLQPQATSVYP